MKNNDQKKTDPVTEADKALRSLGFNGIGDYLKNGASSISFGSVNVMGFDIPATLAAPIIKASNNMSSDVLKMAGSELQKIKLTQLGLSFLGGTTISDKYISPDVKACINVFADMVGGSDLNSGIKKAQDYNYKNDQKYIMAQKRKEC
jgi:hypothetical protein